MVKARFLAVRERINLVVLDWNYKHIVFFNIYTNKVIRINTDVHVHGVTISITYTCDICICIYICDMILVCPEKVQPLLI